MKNYKKIIAIVAVGVACAAATSQAAVTPLSPVLGGTTGGTPPLDTIYGAAVAPEMQSTFTHTDGGGTVTGTLDSWVYAGGNTAPAGYQGYEFVYQLIAAAGSDSLEHLVLNGFGGVPIAVAISAGGGTITPGNASRLPNSDQITWDYTFPNQIPAGDESYLMIVYTSLSSFGSSVATVQDGTAANDIRIYAPVPEPTTVMAGALMLLPLGVGAVRALRRDRTV